MQTFLEDTLDRLKNKHTELSDLLIILPSKRAGGFLKNHLKQSAAQTYFAPRIIAIEDFIEELSGLTPIDPIELLFKSYEVYTTTIPASERESFENFSGWAVTLLNDINEVDRYLVDARSFFNYLGSIKTMERWNIQGEASEMIQKYLRFWEQLFPFYQALQKTLLEEEVGYQGLLYRMAASNIEQYISKHSTQKHVFIGFNALNAAEQHIFQELLKTGLTEVYWDAEETFFQDKHHGASLFVRNYFSNWPYYQNNTPLTITDHYQTPKNIRMVATQNDITQAKYVGDLLATLSPEQLDNTAVILADENLLVPIINSLPPNVDSLNITMGVGLRNMPVAMFFEELLHFQTTRTDLLYYKQVLELLQQPSAQLLFNNATKIIQHITTQNMTHFSCADLESFGDSEDVEMLRSLFGTWKDKGENALSTCLILINYLKDRIQRKTDLAALFEVHQIFIKLQSLHDRFQQLNTVKSVQQLFIDLLSNKTLDFQGDAYEGLQIMGVLETRVLDFERIIMTSLNEGILPAGKSNASFITYDLKKEFDLPSYIEKDAIYTYHFYHLLHRAKEITLLYKNVAEGLNSGEKSRFLLQLEMNRPPAHTYTNSYINTPLRFHDRELKKVEKTPEILKRIKEIANKGFSPSSLTSYIRNPLDFYFQKILRLQEYQEVEETVAANTLGTIVHDTLELFYKPLEQQILTIEHLENMEQRVHETVTEQFRNTFREGAIDQGKNLIIFEVAKRYIQNFLKMERAEIEAGHTIKLLHIESNMKIEVSIPELDFPIYIGGKVDRIDEYDGRKRIIDYKTGKVQANDLRLKDWDELIQDYKHSKAFQVLAYASMMEFGKQYSELEAGIISFKNLKAGFLKFDNKETGGSIVTSEVLERFEEQLKTLILEICDPQVAFIEKEV
ncbi:MAG: PD-(D/E)XK nuclease family protein [Flavobacteriaceae bacterium]|nr:PD-(D/E)XK nuclease family protein [Flavobacteriaceae bacterium]